MLKIGDNLICWDALYVLIEFCNSLISDIHKYKGRTENVVKNSVSSIIQSKFFLNKCYKVCLIFLKYFYV